MDQTEYELAVAVLSLKQSIENFEAICKPPIPLEYEKKRHRVWVDPIMKKHSSEVKVFRIEEMSKHKKTPLA